MGERRVALIVAVDDYADDSLRRLAAPVADARALADALSDSSLGAFDVDVVVNEPSYRIREQVESFFAERGPEDLALLHFSCHGIKDDSGELFLASSDTRPTRLGSTAVDAAFVGRLMRRSRAHSAVLLLDCCYGGAFERGLVPRDASTVDVGTQFSQQNVGGGKGRVVITASSAVEYAFEEAQLVETHDVRPSLFTGAIVEGVTTGEADRDNDGRVSLSELYDYVFDRVREQTPNQTPSKWEFGLEGELIIARNPHRRVTPAALPPELLEVAFHPLTASRHGGVLELGRLANSDNLPLAAAAREELQRMTEDDSRRVSNAAADALERTQLQLSTSLIDFGQLNSGQPSPVAEVEIEGPPLAEASDLASSSPVIHVRRADRTIHASVDTSSMGPIEEFIKVSGPAGDATVTVRAAVRDSTSSKSALSQPLRGRNDSVDSGVDPSRAYEDGEESRAYGPASAENVSRLENERSTTEKPDGPAASNTSRVLTSQVLVYQQGDSLPVVRERPQRRRADRTRSSLKERDRSRGVLSVLRWLQGRDEPPAGSRWSARSRSDGEDVRP